MKNERVPKYFRNWQKNFDDFSNWLLVNKLTPIEACIKFIQHFKDLDRVIIGIENVNQLLELNKIIEKKSSFKMPNFNVIDERLINPSKWIL